MKFNFKALVLASAVVAAPAFANPDFTDLGAASDFASAQTAITAMVTQGIADYTTGAVYDTNNYGFVTQLGNGNIAIIDQDNATGVGNFAAIIQDGSTNPGVAVINQSGTNNFAAIRQR